MEGSAMSAITTAISDVVGLSTTMVTAITSSAILVVVLAVPFAKIGLGMFRSMFKTARR